MQAPRAVSGSCLCGSVTFEISLPSKFVAHCHCSLCRRAHGAPYVTWVGIKEEQFQLLAGEEVLKEFHSTPQATRGFCGNCGSPLFFRSTRWPDEIHVAVAHLKNPLDKAPTAHVFYDDKAEWVRVEDGLKRLGGKSGLEPL